MVDKAHYDISIGVRRFTRKIILNSISQFRIPQWRTLSKFAEDEIILSTGPFAGRRFRLDRQPYIRHLYDEINKETWKEIAVTGPSQSGKTLACFTIPILWHLFERQEDVIVMAPNDDTCKEKWERDIRPIIARSQYAKYLPLEGKGARGGWGGFTQFGNGRFLKWMTAGGSDKRRAHYTARVIFITEVDGMAMSDTTSLESDKVKQVEARGNAYADNKVVYKECTVTVPSGHIWQRYINGTHSKIFTPCPHCKDFVCLEREHFVGWIDKDNEIDARLSSRFFCSNCGEAWSDDDRRTANTDAVLVHSGQTIVGGKLSGEVKKTMTLGFRWSAVNNLLETSANLGAQEWNAAQEMHRDNAEKKMLQFNWCVPYDDPNFTLTRLEPKAIVRRQASWVRGFIPNELDVLTFGIDVHKRSLYWTLIASSSETGRNHIADYGRNEVQSDELGLEEGIQSALRELRTRIDAGWVSETGELRQPSEVWIDSGNWAHLIHAFILDGTTDAGVYRPTLGRGFNQQTRQWYNRPKKTGNIVKYVGEEFHAAYNSTSGLYIIEINVDYWKTMLHSMLQCDISSARRLTLFHAMPQDHMNFAAHLAAEHQEEHFNAERGSCIVWRAHSRNNHWLDSTVLALVSSCAIYEGKRNAERTSESDTNSEASTSAEVADYDNGSKWSFNPRSIYS